MLIFVTTSLKSLFKVDLGISKTSSLEYISLSAISIASSTCTLVYKLLTLKNFTSSSSSSIVASISALVDSKAAKYCIKGKLLI